MTEIENEFLASFELEKGWLDDAPIAFKAAGAEPPKDELVACGRAGSS
jgi:hypothetical protein